MNIEFLKAKRLATGPTYRINRAKFFYLKAKRLASGPGYRINRAKCSKAKRVATTWTPDEIDVQEDVQDLSMTSDEI